MRFIRAELKTAIALGCRPTEQHQDPLEEVVLVGSQMDSEAVQFEVGMIRLRSELHHILCKFEDEQNQQFLAASWSFFVFELLQDLLSDTPDQ